ncbi:MAG: sulfite exporter TauE/SafE family protein [Mailhella sp.]|nr:sulfite exporter TauE/SafE family protein [Mailhella sp.]
MTTILFLYILCGAIAGFLSGLIGIGGGLVVVPLLNMIFRLQGDIPAELIMHLAVGTSLSSILFTAISSARSHARRGGVLWGYVKGLAPAIVLGTICAAWLASRMSTSGLRGFFVAFLLCVATQMLFDFYPHPRRTMPGRGALAAAGFTIGGVSSLVGLGGGSMSVPFLRWCGVEMRQAVGTSAAISWPIAVSGTIGFVIVGWGAPDLPNWTLGYVSLPATLGIACTSVFFAPLGVKLAHTLSVPVLRRFFAVFLYVTACEMLWNIFH